MTRILLGQLSANGDCLYATAIARQVKQDFPDCHLTWAISTACRPMIEGNPHVDAIWEIGARNRKEQRAAWEAFEIEVLHRVARQEFDRVYLSQIFPGNFRRYDGTVRPSMMRAYPRPITVPLQPVLRLSDAEIERVADFARASGLESYRHRLLFECGPLAGQSYVNPDYARHVAERLVVRHPDACVILSSATPVTSEHAAVIDGSPLSIRENAALTHFCSHFIGSGSGLTVVALSDAAKPLPMLQLLAGQTSVYASFHHDFAYWGLATDMLMEMVDVSPETAVDCLSLLLTEGLGAAKGRYHQTLLPDFRYYAMQIDHILVQRNRMVEALESLETTASRYGWHPFLVEFAQRRVIPGLRSDPSLMIEQRRELARRVIETIRGQAAVVAS